jgi:hypothetical protein
MPTVCVTVRTWALGRLRSGRQVLVIRDTRPDTAAVPGQDDKLFDDWRLPLSAELKKRFKADVAQRLPAEAAQRRAVEADPQRHAVDLRGRGAGAGKSTSLVLRILLLRHYLGFELDAMTVVTFTRESRKDFIQRLLQVFALWQVQLSPAQGRELVRTFHSRILPLVRSLPGFSGACLRNPRQRDACRRPVRCRQQPLRLLPNDAQRQRLNLSYRDLLARARVSPP